MNAAFEHLLTLSVADRLQLIEDLWDSIADDLNAADVTPAQRYELDRRLEQPRSGPMLTWQEVRSEITAEG